MEQQLYRPQVESKKRHEYMLSKMYERFGRIMMLAAQQRRKNAYRIERRQARRKARRSMMGNTILSTDSY